VTAVLGAGPAVAGKPGTPRPPTGERPAKADQLLDWAHAEAEHPGDKVTVEILLDPTARGSQTAATDAVRAAGGRVTGSVPGRVLQAQVAPSAIDALRRVPGVQSLRRPLPQNYRLDDPAGLGPLVQATIGEEITHTNAAAWHAAGHTGAGVKIGIVDGFHGAVWDTAAAAGDLPAQPAGTFCLILGNECDVWASGVEHGVAVAELIHELAPGAQLYVATALSATDLQAAVDWFVANGVTVVNRSLGAALDGPGDGTGPLNEVADNAVAAGIAWFNSAGNEAGRGTELGNYYRAPFTDTDGDGWHEFVDPSGVASDTFENLAISCASGYLMSSLRWDDWGDPGQATDYDLFAFATPDTDGNGNAEQYDITYGVQDAVNHAFDFGAGWQGPGGGEPPLEHLGLGNAGNCSGTVYLAIRMDSVNDGTDDVIEIMAEDDIELWSNPGSAGYPIVDSANPGVFGMGAVDADHGIADYSSEGPTNDGRIKPDFTARSGVQTVGLPNFHGTSASSPIAAGLSALVLAAGHAHTPAELRAWLLARASVDGGASGPDSVYGHGELILPNPDGGPPPPPSGVAAIVPIDPTRYLDTRGGPTFDGTYTAGGRLPGGFYAEVEIAGAFGPVPDGAAGVAVNLTAVDAGAPGHATLFPCPAGDTAEVPKASHVNYRPGQAVANNVVVPLGAGGRLCIGTHADADFVLDVNGYVPAGSPLGLFTPARYLDTRPGAELFDGVSPGGGPVPAESQVEVQVAGRGGVPAGATAAIVSVTAVTPDGPGFVSLYPCSGDPRAASTLNYAPGEVVPNGSIAQLSPTGTLCVWTKASAHLLVDVAGYVPAGTTTLTTRPPARLLDTRTTGFPIAAEQMIEVQITGQAGVPANATAAILNAGAVAPDGPGYLTLWPCGVRPTTSNVNYTAGAVRANNTLTKLSPSGTVCIFSKAASHVIVDITGWVIAGS
jgi:hypothetical protein